MDKPLYHKQLLVWKKSVNISKNIYEITNELTIIIKMLCGLIRKKNSPPGG